MRRRHKAKCKARQSSGKVYSNQYVQCCLTFYSRSLLTHDFTFWISTLWILLMFYVQANLQSWRIIERIQNAMNILPRAHLRFLRYSHWKICRTSAQILVNIIKGKLAVFLARELNLFMVSWNSGAHFWDALQLTAWKQVLIGTI